MSDFTNPAEDASGKSTRYVNAVLALLGDSDPLDLLDGLHERLLRETQGLSEETLARSEEPGKWSMLEVIQHLADSELVWSYRLRMVITQDRPEITGYDQDLWARRLGYHQTSLEEALTQIRILRLGNLRLLRSLSASEWQRVGFHKERGEESIRHMVKLYAGHDLVHCRQLSRIAQKVRH